LGLLFAKFLGKILSKFLGQAWVDSHQN
jgi:hypothetical protein